MRRSLPMILIRAVMGLFFIYEGILKFLYTQSDLDVLVTTGLPLQRYLGPILGGIEIFGGAAILVSLFAGDAALMLLIAVGASVVATKLPILTGAPVGPFPVPKVPAYGMEPFVHEARIELIMLGCALFVLFTSGLSFLQKKRSWHS
jgi:uncharacterized membrane protein YphA (DoxX/SURF4 family)